MEISQIVWLALFVILLSVEASTSNLVTCWFAVGSLFALVISFISPQLYWLQMLTFAIVSLLALVLFKPILVKKLSEKNEKVRDVFDGEIGIVTTEPEGSNKIAYVKIHDVLWKAKTDDEIKKGDEVYVIEQDGNLLTVKKVEEKHSSKNDENKEV